MTTQSTKSIIVCYPHIPPRGAWTSIPNTPKAVAAYVRAVAPHLAALADDVLARRPDLAARTWFACLAVIEGKVQLDTRPRIQRLTCHRHGTVEALATVAGRSGSFEVFDWRYLHCTCNDTSAPETRCAIHTCQHIIAYVLTRALDE
jgi:hypothetical protein